MSETAGLEEQEELECVAPADRQLCSSPAGLRPAGGPLKAEECLQVGCEYSGTLA